MTQKVSFYTLGCRLNQSETAVIRQSFRDGAYDVVDIHEPADLVVINTCTVTENGDADTRKLVHKICAVNPDTKIALVGCQAQTQKAKLTELPNVRWVIGNEKKMETRHILEELCEDDSPHVITPAISRKNFTLPKIGPDAGQTRANLKIQDGCDFFCSFCEIPFARGRARSRLFADILKEAKVLAEKGYREVILTGINLGTYTQDGKSLTDVLEVLVKITGIERVRISSIEPTTIPWDIIQMMGAHPKVCRHLHIPLQSGNDKVLASMKRKYSLKEFDDFIEGVKRDVPGVCLGTDVIVGYPEEDEECFRQTVDYLKTSALHYFHVFSYSQRLHANSRRMTIGNNATVIKERSRMLRKLGERKQTLFLQSGVGKTHRVLFENQKDGLWRGLTDNFIRVAVNSPRRLRNQFHLVRGVEVKDGMLLGEMFYEKSI